MIAERRPAVWIRGEVPHPCSPYPGHSVAPCLVFFRPLLLHWSLSLLMLSSYLFSLCSACHPVITLDFFLPLPQPFFPFHCLSQAECKPINIPGSPWTTKPSLCQCISNLAGQICLKSWANAALTLLLAMSGGLEDGAGWPPALVVTGDRGALP